MENYVLFVYLWQKGARHWYKFGKNTALEIVENWSEYTRRRIARQECGFNLLARFRVWKVQKKLKRIYPFVGGTGWGFHFDDVVMMVTGPLEEYPDYQKKVEEEEKPSPPDDDDDATFCHEDPHWSN
jgi:thiamine kinase-like enzyme